MLFDVQDLAIDFLTPQGVLHAVRGVSFQLREGEVLGMVGESGSGKSVTALSLLNLLPGNGLIKDGRILYQGRQVLRMGPGELRAFRGAEASMIFQEPSRSFDPIYSIERNLREAILAHRPQAGPEEIREKSIQLLREVNILDPEERMQNFPHQFSGGMLQRIMIALSLASDPQVLIADEPTTALDVTIQAQIVELLLDLKARRNLAILFISHNLALIASVADRILVMYGGLVVEEGPADRVLRAPLFPYARALLDSLPHFGDHYREVELATIPGTVPDPYHPEPGCPFAPRCPLAVERCREEVPPMREEGPGRHHRCIFPGAK
jgi:oligopeptide/dipeptide ABC transporter ATP-binding protein